ncbi:right-handed parallel beta-helix repeat-containing protein [Fulvimarina sp. 2208YS6-2-32]|uniref:Right-handed parallel beta-helix repeat-containing protein n=1 Tax=Fulvimarina uroteuthidis TaxID=3098149 RepID=A0ABU5I142_9HYPH|nr:right-handed parallel beta-helix repeat-containing protein [Fulvimarina sp. 2208YS6-2-32]MDY8108790.1 right-handed parallel beta-helix repeat-containing protein [Fulvimarina sp. 2208YS6-2-32]
MAQGIAASVMALLSLVADCDTPPGESDETVLSQLRPDRAAPGPRSRPCPRNATAIAPGEAIQPLVDRAEPGAAFCLQAGVHRGQIVAPKSGQQFVGAPGAVMRGSILVGAFEASGPYFSAPAPFPRIDPRGTCLAARPACDRTGSVFVDGRPLGEVATLDELSGEANRFFFDRDANRIVLASDPRGRTIEASAAAFAFLANGASDVLVADLVIEHYANPAQRGAVYDDTDRAARGWTIAHNDIRLNSGLGVLGGPRSTIVGNRITDNGQLGVAFSSPGVTVLDNLVAGNNREGFDPAWEAGGLKGASAENAVIAGNLVIDNRGPGLWCDIECRGTRYSRNVAAFNEGPGIFHEISGAALIEANVLRCNGMAASWFWGAGILLASTQGVSVTGNLVVVPADGSGIAIIDQGRPDAVGGLYQAAGNQVTDNLISFEGAFGRMGAASDVDAGSPNEGRLEAGHNRFDANTYHVPAGFEGAFAWGADEAPLTRLPVAGHETHGSMVVRVDR